MSSNLFNTDYNSGGSSDNNDNNYDNEERDSLKLSNYAIVSFEIGRLSKYDGQQYGQSLIVDVDDVRVLDGLVYDRFYSDDDDTIKVFGYDKWFRTNEHGQLDEEITDNLVNQRITEEFGGTQYPYEFVDRATQDEDNIDLGDMTMWLSNGTKNRTFAKVVTPAGHDVIDDKEDDFNWLNDKVELRDDLEGRRVILFYKKDSFVPDDGDEPVEFTDAVLLDENTRAGITIQNGESDSSSSSSDSSDSDDSGGDSGSLGGDSSGLPDGVPDELDDIIGFMARTNETEKENVEQLVTGELEDASISDVDLDAVVSEIENRR